MAKTKIEWATDTWNPITGCSKISEACKHCYAERMAKRLAGRCGYPEENPFSVTLHRDKLDQPVGWKKPRRVFVCSMGDIFHDGVLTAWLDEVFSVILTCSQLTTHDSHIFMVLTKRPARMREYLTDKKLVDRLITYSDQHFRMDNPDLLPSEYLHARKDELMPMKNLWLGVTVENQARADERIPLLREIDAPVHFVSCEPLLEQVNLDEYMHCGGCGYTQADKDIHGDHHLCKNPTNLIDWVITGAETGQGARFMDTTWAAILLNQCSSSGTPFFFKKDSQGVGTLFGQQCHDIPEVQP